MPEKNTPNLPSSSSGLFLKDDGTWAAAGGSFAGDMDDIPNGTTYVKTENNYTDAEVTKVSNLSGTNTGDNATNTQYSGLAASKQDTLVSATNIKTVNGSTLLGAGDLVVSGSDATKLAILNNLSDLNNAGTARTNLGLDTTANQTDSVDKRFMTDAQETKLDAVVLPTGTPDGTKYLRDDNSWQVVSGGSGLTQSEVLTRLSFRI